MNESNRSGEINVSKVPVEGIGGLGLVTAALFVAIAVPTLRWLSIAALIGGTAIGLFLISARNRRARRSAEIGGVMLLIAVATGAYLYFGR